MTWTSSLFILSQVLGGAPPPAPDTWLAEPAPHPPFVEPSLVLTNPFATLQAEYLAGRLKVSWTPSSPDTNGTVTLHASADPLGHWPARDWQSYPGAWLASSWQFVLPVDHVDIPIVYFVSVRNPASGAHLVSPMRVCMPRGLGLNEPTRVFWPFLEGFEEGHQSWRLLSRTNEGFTLSLSSQPKNGKSALLVSIPPAQRSVTVATTRVRGWQVLQHDATGLGLWLRTLEGETHARFTLLAHALTTNQLMAPCRWEATLNKTWQPILIPFADFDNPPLSGLDLFTIELIGTGPCQFLLDDLQLLGAWPLE